MSKRYVGHADELKAGLKTIVEIDGIEYGIFHVDGTFYAWRNRCPHAGAKVCLGPVQGTALPSGVYEYEYGMDRRVLRCPWHGWEFDLRTGRHLANPQVRLRGVPVTMEDNAVYVWMEGAGKP